MCLWVYIGFIISIRVLFNSRVQLEPPPSQGHRLQKKMKISHMICTPFLKYVDQKHKRENVRRGERIEDEEEREQKWEMREKKKKKLCF
jgi:hypothetical protein